MYLICYSKVTLKFVVPVLNETTANVPKTFGTTETSETAKYHQMLDQFVDYFNVRSLEKHQKKTKLFLKPYINENVLIHGKNTQNRPGDLTQNARSEMFVCLQTWHINRCNRSTVKAVNFLLQNSCIFILTERFHQDPVEE